MLLLSAANQSLQPALSLSPFTASSPLFMNSSTNTLPTFNSNLSFPGFALPSRPVIEVSANGLMTPMNFGIAGTTDTSLPLANPMTDMMPLFSFMMSLLQWVIDLTQSVNKTVEAPGSSITTAGTANNDSTAGVKPAAATLSDEALDDVVATILNGTGEDLENAQLDLDTFIFTANEAQIDELVETIQAKAGNNDAGDEAELRRLINNAINADDDNAIQALTAFIQSMDDPEETNNAGTQPILAAETTPPVSSTTPLTPAEIDAKLNELEAAKKAFLDKAQQLTKENVPGVGAILEDTKKQIDSITVPTVEVPLPPQAPSAPEPPTPPTT